MVFLQVRLDSTRLPGKALELLGGITLTEQCFQALSPLPYPKVLVTEPTSVESLEPLALASGWKIFSGSKLDVLDRFVQAGRKYGAKTVIRATGDNPLVSAQLAGMLLELHLAKAADYSGFQGAPLGTGVEILSFDALEKAWASPHDAYEREHVSPYLYRRPDEFHIHRPKVPQGYHWPEGRVTVDTPQDLAYLRKLWQDQRLVNPAKLEELIPWLKKHPHPDL